MPILISPRIAQLPPYRPGRARRDLAAPSPNPPAALAANEAPWGPSPKVAQAIAGELRRCRRYPDPRCTELRDAFCALHAVPEDEVVFGCGSNSLIDYLCRVVQIEGQRAIVALPSFPLYDTYLRAAGATVDTVALKSHIAWDADALLAAVSPQTRLLFVANPNNPSGSHVARATMERLLEQVPDHVLIVVDEAYAEFGTAADFVSAISYRSERPGLCILRTFSKAYGLAGLRLGAMLAPTDVAAAVERLAPPFRVSSVAQAAGVAALQDHAHLESVVCHVAAERRRVSAGLEELGLRVAPSQGNFVFYDSGCDSELFCRELETKGVFARQSVAPVRTWVRLSIGTVEENDRALRAVAEATARCARRAQVSLGS